jgi:prepilin-type processing-associated H-X9-DG protein
MKNRQLPTCPSWKGLEGCAAKENLTVTVAGGLRKPYSYGINTVESWGLYKPWTNKQADHHGFRCQGPRRAIDVGCSVSMSEVEDPAGTIWITDSTNIELWQETFLDYNPRNEAVFTRHNGGFNTVHGDGHVKWYKAGSTKPYMWSIELDDSP